MYSNNESRTRRGLAQQGPNERLESREKSTQDSQTNEYLIWLKNSYFYFFIFHRTFGGSVVIGVVVMAITGSVGGFVVGFSLLYILKVILP